MRSTTLSPLIAVVIPLAGAAVFVAPPLPAQQATGTVPEDFVRAMVGDAELLIGALPENMPEALAWPRSYEAMFHILELSGGRWP